MVRDQDNDRVHWPLVQDTVGQDVQLRVGDGGVNVAGGGHNNQTVGAGHNTGNGLANTELGAQVTVVIQDTWCHTWSHLLSHIHVVCHGVVEVGGEVWSGGLLFDDDTENDGGDENTGQEEDDHGHGDDDHKDWRCGGLCGDRKHIKVATWGGVCQQSLILMISVATGDLQQREDYGVLWKLATKNILMSLDWCSSLKIYLIEIFDSTFIKRINCLNYPGAICLGTALPPIVVNGNQVHLHSMAGDVEIEADQEVVVESEDPELGQEAEDSVIDPLNMIVIQF